MAGNGYVLLVISPSADLGSRICTSWNEAHGCASKPVTTLWWVQTASTSKKDTEPGRKKNHWSDLGKLSLRPWLDGRNPCLILQATLHLFTCWRARGNPSSKLSHFCLHLKSLGHPDLLSPLASLAQGCSHISTSSGKLRACFTHTALDCWHYPQRRRL